MKISKLLQGESGASIVEYAVLVSSIALLALVSIAFSGERMAERVHGVACAMGDACDFRNLGHETGGGHLRPEK